jgi:LEA14-like dessication related protein
LQLSPSNQKGQHPDLTPTESAKPTPTPAATKVEEVTVDLTGVTTGMIRGDMATIILFLTVANPSSSSITLTSIEYEAWISDTPIGPGGTREVVPVDAESKKEIRTDMTTDLTELPKQVVDALTVENCSAKSRVKGTLHIKDGFGTLDIPFEDAGEIGVPISG